MGPFGLLVNMKWKSTRRPAVNKSGKKMVWKYAQADFAKARSLIDDTDWDLVLTGDVSESLTNCETKFMELDYGDVHPKEITFKKEKSSVDDKRFDESDQQKKWLLSACKAKWKPVTL